MWIIDFLKANCKNCYACVRACPVNAIKVQAEQANIMMERCIGCGKCLKVCPKNAKHVQSELYKVKAYLASHEKVVVSVAPSFAAVWGRDARYLPGLLKQLGFFAVEETVVGAQLVTKVYETYANMPGDQCYITSCCPTVNAMIQKHYPEIIPFLIPVISPVACHSKLIKQKYGKETKVVFLGPCLSKKIEGMEEETIDAVLTFEEFNEWIFSLGMEIQDQPIVPFDATEKRQRRYPIVGGVTASILPEQISRQVIYMDGIEECKELMPSIMAGDFKNCLIEMHGCRHGCIAGAGMPADGINIHKRKERILEYATVLLEENQYQVLNDRLKDPQKGEGVEEVATTKMSQSLEEKEAMGKETEALGTTINLHKSFLNLQKTLTIPSEEEITAILSSIGKETPLDELNCGSCGYATCREKAIAVYNGLAEPYMCLPYMRQKAETLTNVLFEATPNMIIMINEALEIIELNPAACKFFHVGKGEYLYFPIGTLMEEEPFIEVRERKENILNQKVFIQKGQQTVIQSIIWSEYHQIILWIGSDVTYDEAQAKKLQHMKIEAIDMAQHVINKQMTVAQEIASLLGETTAETKVTLTKLKQLIQEEEAIKQ